MGGFLLQGGPHAIVSFSVIACSVCNEMIFHPKSVYRLQATASSHLLLLFWDQKSLCPHEFHDTAL